MLAKRRQNLQAIEGKSDNSRQLETTGELSKGKGENLLLKVNRRVLEDEIQLTRAKESHCEQLAQPRGYYRLLMRVNVGEYRIRG